MDTSQGTLAPSAAASTDLPPYAKAAKLWGLRMLVELGVVRKINANLSSGESPVRELLQVFGLDALLELYDGWDEQSLECLGEDEAVVARRLKRKLSSALQLCFKTFTPAPTDPQDDFTRNLQLLAQTLGLNETERLLLHFGLLATQLPWMKLIVEGLGESNGATAVLQLARVLRVPAAEIRAALSSNGLLVRSGLLSLRTGNICMDLTDRLEVLDGLMEALLAEHADTLGLFHKYFRRATAADLEPQDFAGCAQDYTLIREYLKRTRASGDRGVNLLIYGHPGVGKTQLARVVAQDIGLSLYEVATTDAQDEALNGEHRLQAFALGQRVLARNPDTLIVFDEAEDIFGECDSFFALFSNKPGRQTKAAINRLLEENPVPTLWLTNSTDSMDPAYLRRFQYVLELRGGTRGTRTKSFAKHLTGLPVSQACIQALAENEALAPAVVANAASVLRRLAIQDEAHTDAALRRVIEHTLEAMGLPCKPALLVASPTRYELEYSNPDTDLDELLAGLRRRPQARLCLYGPAGTGKTAFGKYLTEQLDKPLLVRRASDLLSPWVGMSEKHIAAMFKDAEREDAVLLLDEADSFLRERSGAHASWEVTQVNEVLTQMEAFEGLFIASTNLMDTLDAASLRRFDFKIRFNYLSPLQAEKMFRSVLDAQAGGTIAAELMVRLMKLGTLTPGDFAVVVRKARVYAIPLGPERLIQGLEQECRIKDLNNSRPIGFTAY